MRIKELALDHRLRFTNKALNEMDRDGLRRQDVVQSIVNATFVRTKRSRSPHRERAAEKVHIIEAFTFDGRLIYTKGVIRKVENEDIFYILISAKRSTTGGGE